MYILHLALKMLLNRNQSTAEWPSICCGLHAILLCSFISARCNIYISRLCYDVNVRLSVCLSVTEVLWHIIANLGLKSWSQFTVHCGRGACGREGRDHRREEGPSRAMLATARPSCYSCFCCLWFLMKTRLLWAEAYILQPRPASSRDDETLHAAGD